MDVNRQYKRKPGLILIFALGMLLALSQAIPRGMALASETEQAPEVADIRIRILSAADKNRWESLARDLLPLKKGEPYTLGALEETITALKDSRLFEAVHIPDPMDTREGVILTFELTPFPRINDIRIHNAFPLFHREVLTVMNMETGGPFDPETLKDQPGRIRRLFAQQGFPRAEVRVAAEENPEARTVTVDVDITKGAYRKIRAVTFEGNQAVSATRLGLSCKTWRATLLFGTARRFVPEKMKADVRTLTQLYREKGFADVEIAAGTAETGTGREVDVIFTIREGPLYQIRFLGNEAIPDRTLKQEMTLAKAGNQNNFALKKSLRNIRKTYRDKGYADARIEKQQTVVPGPTSGRRVDIRIEEGPRLRVAALSVTGNEHISSRTLRESILTPEAGGVFNDRVFEEDARAIRSLYLQEGFAHVDLDNRITTRNSDDGKTRWVTAELAVTEGPRVRVNTVAFSGLTALSREEALSVLTLTPGRPFDPTRTETDTAALRQALLEAGYPHARLTAATPFTGDGTGADITYSIDQGPEVRVGRIFYTGNLRTRETILTAEMAIAPGDPFVLSRIVDSRRNLLNLSAVDSARIRSVGLKTRETEVDLIVEISEKKPYFMEAGTGYDTERHLYVTAGAGDRNLAGRNLNLQSGAELSQIGHKLDISLTEPSLFATRIISSTRAFTESREEFNKDFGIRTYGISQDFVRRFPHLHLSANLGFVYEFRDQYLTAHRTLTADEASEFRTRHIGAVSPGITFRTTDSYIRPRKGILATATVDLSKGIDTDLDDFIKFRTDLRYYIPVAGPLTLALRGRYGHILPYGNSARFPDDQLFFLGGTATVRGFDENMLRFDADGDSVGGLEMIMGSAEARIDLGRNIEAALFYDTGTIKRTQGRAGDGDFRDSAGLGLRYQTPVGPIGLLYGWKLDPKPGESPGSFHFSMGYTF